MPFKPLAATLCALCLALPASAAAQNAPPGNSGVDQYLETVPDAGGDRTPRGGRGSEGDRGGGQGSVEGERSGQAGLSLPPGTAGRLEAAGAEGAALERLVASAGSRRARAPASRSTSRVREPASARSEGGEAQAGDQAARSTPSERQLETLRSAPGALTATSLTGAGSGGMGLLLPALLALITLGTVALALRSRRS